MRKEQIDNRIAEIREAGWKPVLLVINLKVLDELEKEIGVVGIGKLSNYLGLPIIIEPTADFFVVDDRSWVYQK
jgi:hypothetical protein